MRAVDNRFHKPLISRITLEKWKSKILNRKSTRLSAKATDSPAVLVLILGRIVAEPMGH